MSTETAIPVPATPPHTHTPAPAPSQPARAWWDPKLRPDPEHPRPVHRQSRPGLTPSAGGFHALIQQSGFPTGALINDGWSGRVRSGPDFSRMELRVRGSLPLTGALAGEGFPQPGPWPGEYAPSLRKYPTHSLFWICRCRVSGHSAWPQPCLYIL